MKLKTYVFAHKYADWADTANDTTDMEFLRHVVYAKFGEETIEELI